MFTFVTSQGATVSELGEPLTRSQADDGSDRRAARTVWLHRAPPKSDRTADLSWSFSPHGAREFRPSRTRRLRPSRNAGLASLARANSRPSGRHYCELLTGLTAESSPNELRLPPSAETVGQFGTSGIVLPAEEVPLRVGQSLGGARVGAPRVVLMCASRPKVGHPALGDHRIRCQAYR